MDQFSFVLQTLLIQTVHLDPPTPAALVQPVLQARTAAASVPVQVVASDTTTVRCMNGFAPLPQRF